MPDTVFNNKKRTLRRWFSVRDITIIGMMMALILVMLNTPLGTISLPMVRITIAHVPILITALLIGLPQGVFIGAFFGCSTLVIALTQPVSVLDPLFVNPLVSVLPRVLIPITTYYSYKLMKKITAKMKGGEALSLAVSLALGNLTNTFGVYIMLYLVYARSILDLTGTPALTMILGLISTTTAIKCAGIVILGTPIVLSLKKALRLI